MIIKIGSSHSICSEKSASLTAPDSKFITIRENFDHLIRMSGARTALRDVVALLENPDGVHAFRNWLSIDPARTIDALDLYLALRGLSLLIENEDPNSQRTACHIHRKYISLRTGSCHFLPHDARLEMSSRIHSLPPSLPTFSPPLPPIDLFSPIHDHLHNHLSYLHSQFITTKLFHDFVHMVTSTSSFDVQEATTSYPTIQRSMQAIEIEESDGEREEIERNELNGGGGIVGMDKPPIVPPHRSFTFNTVKRKRVKVPLLVEPTPFRHDRPEGRLHFAAVLSEKLDHLRMEIAQQRNEDEKNAFKKPAFEETTSDEEVANTQNG
ncbi:unnamed protein product, partial [Mesorhabditis belari]|uniref:RGS domain-containing protein n=1 Tax=Mesorhabditis belari TaxID=2138241 RepID=A0AAF3J8M8_9BILA